MLLGDLIKEYRVNNNLSLRTFAKRCGLSHTYISALEKNIDSRTGKPIAPTLDTIKYISKGLELSVEEILKILDDEEELKINTKLPKYDIYMCPVYSQTSTIISNWKEECIEGRLPIDPNLLNIICPEECFFFRVTDESMNKLISNNNYALIRKTNFVDNGEIAVVLVNNSNISLKKFSRQGDLIVLEPMSKDNNFQVQIYDKNINVKIIGKYIGKFELK